MRKPTFCLYKCENEVADQMCGTCNCTANQCLYLPYRDNTSVSDPKTAFLETQLIFNYIYKHPLQEGLSACSQCVGLGKPGWVKAIRRLKCNHGCLMSNYINIMLFWLLYEWNDKRFSPTYPSHT